MKFLILLFALAVANGQIIMNGFCPDVKVVQNIDLTQYTGVWYEIYRYEQTFQLSGDCVQADYRISSEGPLIVKNSMVFNQTYFDIEGTAIPDPAAANGEAKFLVNFPIAANEFSQYWVLATDYTHHSLVYACTNLPNNNKRVSSWILSRTRNLLPQSVLALDPYIDGEIGLYWNIYRETSQSEDSCRAPNTPTTTPGLTSTAANDYLNPRKEILNFDV